MKISIISIIKNKTDLRKNTSMKKPHIRIHNKKLMVLFLFILSFFTGLSSEANPSIDKDSIANSSLPHLSMLFADPILDLNSTTVGLDNDLQFKPTTSSITAIFKNPTLSSDTNTILSATIDFSGTVDGTELMYITSPGDLYYFTALTASKNYNVGSSTITLVQNLNSFTITEASGNPIPNADFITFFNTITYGNLTDTPTDGNRIATVTVTDANLASTSAQSIIRVYTTPPNAVDDSNSIAANTTGTVTGNVLTNDTGNILTVSEVDVYPTQVSNSYTTLYGSIVMQSNGNYTYNVDETSSSITGLKNGESLIDIVSYTARDNLGIIDYGTLSITINGVDEAPVALDNTDEIIVVTETNVSGNIITDVGVDGADSVDRGLSTLVWETEFSDPGGFFVDYSAPINGTSRTIDGVLLNFSSTDAGGIGIANQNQVVNQTNTNGGHTGYLGYAIDASTNNSDFTELTITFDQPVYNLGFLLVDIDFSQGTSWQDQIQINGSLNGTASNFKFVTTGGVVDAGNNTFYGIGSAIPSDATGNINVFFEQPINELKLSYSYGPDATDADQGGQIAGVSDIYWQGGTGNIVISEIEGNATNVGVTYTGTYGSIIVNSDGSYTYTPNTSNPAVAGLLTGDTLTETFLYRLSDGTSSDTADLIITLKGSKELPTINIDTPVEKDGIVNADEDNDVTVSGTTTDVEDNQIVTITFDDGVNPIVTTTATVIGGIWTATDADISGLNSGTITITANVEDVVANPTSDTESIILDNVNSNDLDDDNDGILDIEELNCSPGFIDLGQTFSTTNDPGTINSVYPYDDVSANFSFDLLGTATWASGVSNQSNGSISGDYINVQPQNTNFENGDVAVYTIDFTNGPVYNVQFKWGGLDNSDRADFKALNSGTNSSVILSNPDANITITGQSAFSTASGSNAPNNSIIVSIPGPVTQITIIAGKENPSNPGNVTMQLYELQYCTDKDTDNDNVPDHLDLDSDNDGIYDAVEAGHNALHSNGEVTGAVGTDGIPDAVQGAGNEDAGTVNYTISDSETTPDGIPNYLDLDSDGDGLPDNVEAQTTAGYISPNADNATTYTTNNGVNSAYLGGITPENTDGTDTPDYIDLDSDNEGGNDTSEAGLTLANNDADNDGLDDNIDATTGYSDPNGIINAPISLPNTQNPDTPEVDYRDDTIYDPCGTVDTDGDGVFDNCDLDADNDGILDAVECDVVEYNDSFEIPNLVSDTANPPSKSDGDLDGEIDIFINQTSIEGWAVTNGGTFDVIYDLFNSSKGFQHIDLYGSPSPANIQKTYTGFTPGSTVDFSLDFSSAEAAFEASVYVNYGSGRVLLTVLKPSSVATVNGASGAGNRISTVIWNTYALELNPTGTSITIDIESSGLLGTGSTGVLIDNIQLSQQCGDFDNDNIPNNLDLDSDNDGIPDNIEAQTTAGYISPNADNTATYTTNSGVNSAYLGGITPENTDSTDTPDYIDLNSDNEGGNDTSEAGLTLAINDSDLDGLDDNTDATTGYSDPNGTIDNPTTLPNNQNTSTPEVDYRDSILDTTPPTAPTLIITEDTNNDEFISLSELSDDIGVEITLPADAVAGDIVSVTDGNGFTETVTLSATDISNGTVNVEFASPGDGGTILATAFITDVAGNVGANSATDTAVIDITTPTIDITTPIEGDGIVNASEDGDVTISGTTTDVEDGQLVTVTFNDGTNPVVTTTATVTGNAWTVTDADISGLDNGNITVTADVTDVALNPATDTETIVLDNTLPTIDITTPIEGDGIVNATEDGDVTISGTTTDVEDGQTVTVTFNDGTNPVITTTATVTGNAWTATDADISGLDNGNITVTADVTDVALNPATDTETIVLDNTTPTIDITTPIEGDGIVNATEDGDVTISGTTIDVEDGQIVTVTFNDGTNPVVTTTATVTGNAWTATDADISGLDNGNITITADVTNVALNPATDTETIVLDNTLPTIDITTPIEGDGIVNAIEDGDVTISGTTTDVEDGQTVTITFNDGTNPIVTTTATVTGNAWTATDADISGLDNGNITVTADVTDFGGNPATDTETIVLDNTTPTIDITTPIEGDDIINATEDGDVTISGTTTDVENGQTVTVTFNDGTNPVVTTTATVTGNAWTATDADISGLDNGNITVTADVTDVALNPATDTETIVLDNTLPTIDITTPIEGDGIVNATEDGDVTISGTTTDVEDGQTVTVTFDDGTNPVVTTTATVTGNAWTATDADISGLDNGNITVTADVTDVALNPANDNEIITLDNTLPTIDITTPIEGDGIVNATEDGDVTISGTTTDVEDGQTVTVTFDDGTNPVVTTTATVTGNAWTATDADISGLDNGNITVTADVTDFGGNPASDTETIVLDNTTPTIDITTPIEGDGIVNATEDGDVTISGTTTDVEDRQTVTVTFNDGTNPVVTTTATVTGNAWTATDVDISGLDNGNITVTADVTDVALNPATDTETIILDNTTPTIDITTPIEGDGIVNATEDGDVTISGTTTDVEDGQTVTITFNDGTNPVVTTTATVTGNAWTATDADISGLDNGNITVTADVTDVALNPATDTETIVLDNTLPTIDITTPIEGDGIVNASEDGDVTISGTTTDVEDGQTVTVTFNDGTNPVVTTTATVTGNTWTATDADISGLDNGNITVTADVTDVALNPATDNEIITLDNTLPTIDITAPIEGDGIVNASEDGDVTISGTTTDVEDGQIVTITFNDGTNPVVTTTATVTGNAWTATDADISGLDNGNITVTADVTDVALNPATDTETIVLDNTLPTIDITAPIEGGIVNASEDGDVTISGTTTDVEDGQTVTVTFNDGTNPVITTTATVTGNAWTATDADISGLDNGNITVTADVTDVALNPATDTEIVILDNLTPTAPTVVITEDTNNDGLISEDEL
ncbi:hypothetical protein EL45_18925, partial [Cellulophaga sp. E6(2014)]